MYRLKIVITKRKEIELTTSKLKRKREQKILDQFNRKKVKNLRESRIKSAK